MASKFANGQDVKQIIPTPIAGKVVRFAFDEARGDINYVVEWTDAAGETHQRSFNEDQIEAV